MIGDPLEDKRLAYAIARAALGLNVGLHGVMRIPLLERFADDLVRDFAGTPLPAASVRIFGYLLPFAESAIGALIFFGVRLRDALLGGAILMLALIFGTALRMRYDTLAQQLVYVAFYAGLIALREYDGFSFDASRG